MAGVCPVPGPEDPVVQGLLQTVDCNVRLLVQGGYGALFQPSSPFAVLLTSLLTLFVAVFGYRLLLGRSQLRISDLALTVLKLGAVLALATQWDAYQTIIYRSLFDGPEQLAGAVLATVQTEGSAFRGDIFAGLQRVLDALQVFATDYSRQVPTTASPLLGGPSFGAMALTLSSAVLLLSTLGVLLAAKIVLGLLLAVGPVFIALLLFDSTRGLFEGWLRAAIACALVPLAVTLLLGMALAMLEPPLQQMAELKAQNAYPLGPVYSVLTLVLVFALVSAGALVAGGVIARGLRLPSRRTAAAGESGSSGASAPAEAAGARSRAVQIAAAAASLERRDNLLLAGGAPSRGSAAAGAYAVQPGAFDRRTVVTGTSDRGGGSRETLAETRLGQGPRRSARPRVARSGPRSTR